MTVDERNLSDNLPPGGETVVASALCEQLVVEKRLVETGALRVRKLVHEDRVTLDIPLTEEIAEVNRVKVDQVVAGPVPVRYEGDVMIVPVVEERVVTYTELILVEEIHIKRRQVNKSAREEVSLRREEIIVERLDPSCGEWPIVEIESLDR